MSLITAPPVVYLPFKAPEEIIRYAVDFSQFLDTDIIIDFDVSTIEDQGSSVAALAVYKNVVQWLLVGGTMSTIVTLMVTVTTKSGQRVLQKVSVPIRRR